MNDRKKKLTDILHGGNKDSLNSWDTTQAAPDLAPLPPGEYLCRCLNGQLFNSKTGTPGYKLTLEVTEGEYACRRVWHDFWLTRAALPMTKRDLAHIGVTDPSQLEQPLPPGILVRVWLSRRRDNEGVERNSIRRMEGAGVEKGDAYTPDADDEGEPLDTSFQTDQFEEKPAPPAEQGSSEPERPPTESPPAAMPDAPGRGKTRKRQEAGSPLSNGVADSAPPAEGR